MTDLLVQFVYALLATCGFCIIFRIPVRKIPIGMIIGALGWVCYQACIMYDMSPVMATFIASCSVGLLSDLSSRIWKEAATVFIIPGILCLVPGAMIYQTMEALLKSEIDEAASIGTKTLMMAGAIAAGLLVIGAVIKVIRAIIGKTVSLRKRI